MRLGFMLAIVALLGAAPAVARERPQPIKPCYYERVSADEAAPRATLRRLGELPAANRHAANQRPATPPCLLLAMS